MSKRNKVLRCEEPAVKEAFCLIKGKPSKINEEEAPSLRNSARKFYENKDILLENVPTFVMIPTDKERKTGPFWYFQNKWNKNNLVRYGHRYLSIHTLWSKSTKYNSFEKSLKPSIEDWIKLYRDTLVSKKESHPIDLISFGYINEFDFDLENFDPSKYINLNYKIGIDSNCVDAISSSVLSFDFLNTAKSINSTIKVIMKSSEIPNKIKLIVEVYSSYSNIKDLTYSDDLLSKIKELKDHAKETFFSFTTSNLKDGIMIATYEKSK